LRKTLREGDSLQRARRTVPIEAGKRHQSPKERGQLDARIRDLHKVCLERSAQARPTAMGRALKLRPRDCTMVIGRSGGGMTRKGTLLLKGDTPKCARSQRASMALGGGGGGGLLVVDQTSLHGRLPKKIAIFSHTKEIDARDGRRAFR